MQYNNYGYPPQTPPPGGPRRVFKPKPSVLGFVFKIIAVGTWVSSLAIGTFMFYILGDNLGSGRSFKNILYYYLVINGGTIFLWQLTLAVGLGLFAVGEVIKQTKGTNSRLDELIRLKELSLREAAPAAKPAQPQPAQPQAAPQPQPQPQAYQAAPQPQYQQPQPAGQPQYQQPVQQPQPQPQQQPEPVQQPVQQQQPDNTII